MQEKMGEKDQPHSLPLHELDLSNYALFVF